MVKINEENSNEKLRIVTWLLAVYLFFTPLDFIQILPGVSILRTLSLFPLIAAVFYIRSMTVQVDRYFLLPIVHTAFLLFTSFYSVSVGHSQGRAISTMLNIALILVLSMIEYNAAEIRLLRKAIVYSGWITAIMLLYASRGFTTDRLSLTIGGMAEDPNYSVGYMILILLHYLQQYLRHKKTKYLGLVAAIIGLVFFTGSRGGLLAVIGAALLLILLWMLAQKLKHSAILRVMMFAGMIAIAVYFIFDFLPLDIRDRFLQPTEILDEGGSGRVKIWASIIESFNGAPLINQLFGMGAATVSFFSYNQQVGHNIWLDSLIETGIIGTAILFAFYSAFLKKAYDLKEHVITSAFFGYMLMALTMSLYRYRPMWNIMLFILILGKSDEVRAEMLKTITN